MSIRSYYEHVGSLADCPKIEVVWQKEHLKEFQENPRLTVWNTCNEILNANGLRVIRYLKGSLHLRDLQITKENARDILNGVKAIDHIASTMMQRYGLKLSFKNCSYDLRSHILQVCSPEMTTTEAYVKSSYAKEIKNIDYLRNPAHWTSKRTGFYANRVIPQAYIHFIRLSQQLNTERAVIAFRGNAACGKSSAAQKIFAGALNERGELAGCLNIDTLKAILQGHVFTAMQVHDEVAYGPLSLYKEDILQNALQYNVIYDGRISSYEELEAVIYAAEKRKSHATIFDFDCPLQTSLCRLLATRQPKGTASSVPPASLLKAREIGYRAGVIARVQKDPRITYYDLYYTDRTGATSLIAKKRGNIFTVLSQKGLEECCRPLTQEEVEREVQQVITQEFVECAVKRGDIPAKCMAELAQWIGFTLYQAAEFHAMGVVPKVAIEQVKETERTKAKYGHTLILPFCGSWLLDFPEIREHLESEHLLHLLGVDEEGRGLHWQSGKFASKLNPQFNPDAQVRGAPQGGFQMKLGYFIVPPKKMDIFKARQLSPKVLQSLEVRGSLGELIGYRFFVHPEAYLHFKPLHDANIPFIKPEDSEYIGTPTSSYRSWAVRAVQQKNDRFVPQPNSVPFIVKLGVTGSQHDNSRLLSREEIEKSIEVQDLYDRMQRKQNDLLVFQENLGLILKDIPNYPQHSPWALETSDSGLIIREFPQELLAGKCRIFSFAALLSTERTKKENQGIGSRAGQEEAMKSLPLIFEVIDATLRSGRVKSPSEFFKKYLIQLFLQAIEPVVLKEGLSLPLHSQNFMFVLDENFLPLAFAIRDHGDTHRVKRTIQTYSWYYRYLICTKLLNVITSTGSDMLRPAAGAPFQIGAREPLSERSIHLYLQQKAPPNALKLLTGLSLQQSDYNSLLQMLDRGFLTLLGRYFDVAKASIVQNGLLPAAEIDSAHESLLTQHNKNLWKQRRKVALDPMVELEENFSKLAIGDKALQADLFVRTLQGTKGNERKVHQKLKELFEQHTKNATELDLSGFEFTANIYRTASDEAICWLITYLSAKYFPKISKLILPDNHLLIRHPNISQYTARGPTWESFKEHMTIQYTHCRRQVEVITKAPPRTPQRIDIDVEEVDVDNDVERL